jgi:hypothetical protein
MAALSSSSNSATTGQIIKDDDEFTSPTTSSFLSVKLDSYTGSYCANCPPSNLLQPKTAASMRSTAWVCHNKLQKEEEVSASTSVNNPSLSLSLGVKSLLSYIEIYNGGTGVIDVYVGKFNGKKDGENKEKER